MANNFVTTLYKGKLIDMLFIFLMPKTESSNVLYSISKISDACDLFHLMQCNKETKKIIIQFFIKCVPIKLSGLVGWKQKKRDKVQRIFIDKNPKLFKCVIPIYLRTGAKSPLL